MADILDTLGNLAGVYAQAQGARVSVRLNAWPWEIPVTSAQDLDGPPGLIRGQVVVRDAYGNIMASIGPDVPTNWLLSAAVGGGLALLFFVIVRGIAARK